MRLVALLLLASCATPAASAANTITTRAAEPISPPTSWAEMTRSPWPAGDASTREAKLASSCGERDAALEQVARALVADRLKLDNAAESDHVVALLRANGEPHLRPRVVSATGRAPIGEELLRAQLESLRGEHTRCGVAIAPKQNREEIAITVAVDALADLAALPTRARTGEWLTLDASLATPATAAKVVVMGPRGLPRTVPASLDQGRVRARFALDQPGAFTVQLVADLAHGPQPVLEARVFADIAPTNDEAPAPGEDAAGSTRDAAAIFRMLVAARANERLSALSRDVALDAIAQTHAERMRDALRTAHDLGDGDLRTRIGNANIEATTIAENVAHAPSIALAHRVLHASPSHRMNMLGNYTRVGIGLSTGADGAVWVCEVLVR